MTYSEYESSIEYAKQKATEFRLHEFGSYMAGLKTTRSLAFADLSSQGLCGNPQLCRRRKHSRHGIGGKMITALWNIYEMVIEAETDDMQWIIIADAVLKRPPYISNTILNKSEDGLACCLLITHHLEKTIRYVIPEYKPVILSKENSAWSEFLQ